MKESDSTVASNSTKHHSGQCLCGNIKFLAQSDPKWVEHCHCQSCRRNTGSVMATFAGFKTENVRFDDDSRQFYASSPGVSRGYCNKCGTPISYESDRFPDEIHLFLGTMDRPDLLSPTAHVHFEEHVDWLRIDDDLPRHAGSSSP